MYKPFSITAAFMAMAFLVLAGISSAQATSLTYNPNGTVVGYSLPGIAPAGQPNFENDITVDWKPKLKTKKGVISGKATLDVSFKGSNSTFLFNANSTDSYAIDKGKYTLHADYIYDATLGKFVLDTTKGKNSLKISGDLSIPSLNVSLRGTLFTADLDAWNYAGDLIGFNTTITGGLICTDTDFGCATHESAYLDLTNGGFNPEVDFKGTIGTAVTTIPLPAAVWLFGSGLLGLLGMARKKAT
jgi:hypothetical protein